jgi:glycosyltransferase involved in cell wall biosynthesis
MSHNPISQLLPQVALQRECPAMPNQPVAGEAVAAEVACESFSSPSLTNTMNLPISANVPLAPGHIDMQSVSASSDIGAKTLRILGIRGIPAAHGGFETFAEHLAIYLVKRGWEVTVYCQEDRSGPVVQDVWKGVRRVRMPTAITGVAGTIVFDWKSTLHTLREKGLVLTLGYNTAIFCALYRLMGISNVINMDGIEWKRQKWGVVAKMWFWLNDWLGCWLGNHLIADHPEIQRHLETRVAAKKISTIMYGADEVTSANASLLEKYDLEPDGYAVLIARAEPENSVLEVVRAWSRKHRGVRLVILGNYDIGNKYQDAVKAAASGEVLFLGAIYEKPVVQALRYFARFYVHGHQVGGTNPSLVESLGTGNAILAQDNRFNRLVSGEGGLYFSNEDECAAHIDYLLKNSALVDRLKIASALQHRDKYTWDKVLREYESLLEKWVDVPLVDASVGLLGKAREA